MWIFEAVTSGTPFGWVGAIWQALFTPVQSKSTQQPRLLPSFFDAVSGSEQKTKVADGNVQPPPVEQAETHPKPKIAEEFSEQGHR